MSRLQTSKVNNFKNNSIEDIIQNAKSTGNIQSVGISIPTQISSTRTNALVYTTIETITEGTTSDGAEVNYGGFLKTFCLPPPIDIIDLHSANWEGIGVGINMVGLNKTRGSTAGAGLQSIVNTLATGVGGITDPTAVSQVATQAIFGDQTYNLESLASNISLNPNIEMAFRSANLRQIQLQFRLVPLNGGQSNLMEEFIDYMREMMYASVYKSGGDSVSFIGYPARFVIKVKTTGTGTSNWSNKTLFSLGDNPTTDTRFDKSGCVLTDLQVSYGENGSYAGHKDGSPGFINLNLTFQETILSTRESIKREYQ